MTSKPIALTPVRAAHKPLSKPTRAHFSSGPCAKRPGWEASQLATESLGRSHRSKIGKTRLKLSIDLTREILNVPSTHRIGMVPASDTGAYEMAMWSLLGARPATMIAWESFGEGWVTDAVKQLKLDADVVTAPYGELPDLTRIDQSRDICFTWNGTTSGVRVPNGDWIRDDREGLNLVDATSGVFAQDIPWAKVDVLTYSWQKVLGGEGGHGVLILGPRAVERLESYTPAWPLPKIFRLTQKGKLIEGIFTGETINTPSMLAVEDYIDALEWSKHIGGLPELMARADANATALNDWVERTPWIENLAKVPATRSNTSVCLTLPGTSEDQVKALVSLLDKEGAAYDIGAYRDAPPGLRIWCGATVDTADVITLTHWLEWAHAQVTA
ncbi:MAG: phosphoserine transaminase [Polymorphobacter sp.]